MSALRLLAVLAPLTLPAANAAVCAEAGTAPTPQAQAAALEIWTQVMFADGGVLNCIVAPESACEVLGPINWHYGDDARDHLTWRIGPNFDNPGEFTYRTVHIYAENDDRKPPYTFTGYFTGPTTSQCDPVKGPQVLL